MADPIRGRFLWHELMTTDTKSAGTFYSKIIGWKLKPWEDGSYMLFMAGDRGMAGLMAHPEKDGHPAWLTYIGAPNVDEAAKQVVALGGKIHKEPTDIPKVGRFAVVADPQGATFVIFTPNPSPQAADAAPTLGDFSWHELATTDWRAALTFYQRLFGWEETSAMDMGPGMGTYQMFGWGGKTMGGMFNKPAEMPGPPSWLPYARVGDAKKTAASIKTAGGQVINGPMEVPGGDWIAQGLDLQGGMFAVHSLKPADSAPAPAAKAPAAAAKKAAPAKKKAVAKAAPKAKAKNAPVKKAAKKSAKKAAKKAAKPARKAAKRPAAKASKKAAPKAKPKTAPKKKAGKKR